MTKLSMLPTASDLHATFREHGLDLPEAQVLAAVQVTGAGAADLKRAIEFLRVAESENPHRMFEMTVLGEPLVSKRPRAVRLRNASGATVGVRMYAEDAEDQMSIAEAVRRSIPAGHVPFGGEVELALDVYRPPLASFVPYKRLLAELGFIRPESKPDFDNHAKIIVDAMRGIVFVDDSQVVVGNVSLWYSATPRTVIRVSGRQRKINK